jgi:hypothetical protein
MHSENIPDYQYVKGIASYEATKAFASAKILTMEEKF